MPASTSPSSTLASTDFTSGSSVTGLTVILALLNTFAAVVPHGTSGWHNATLTDDLARSVTDVTLAGLDGGTATSITFLAKSDGLDASPAVTICCMFFVLAEANRSAGAPAMIWVAKVELAPKLNVTLTPGWAASNCVPSFVKDPVSDDAANTVIDPDNADADGELLALVELPEPLLPLLEQPARAHATTPAATTVKRRNMNS